MNDICIWGKIKYRNLYFAECLPNGFTELQESDVLSNCPFCGKFIGMMLYLPPSYKTRTQFMNSVKLMRKGGSSND